MKVFDARMAYNKDELQHIMIDDKKFTGEYHHWALRFHKCAPEEIENAGFLCDKAWLNAIRPDEVRTQTANIADLDRGTFEW